MRIKYNLDGIILCPACNSELPSGFAKYDDNDADISEMHCRVCNRHFRIISKIEEIEYKHMSERMSKND